MRNQKLLIISHISQFICVCVLQQCVDLLKLMLYVLCMVNIQLGKLRIGDFMKYTFHIDQHV